MRIGVDIDGTINQAHFYNIIHGRQFMDEHNKFCGFDGTKQYPKDMYHMDKNTYDQFMDKWFPWNVRNCPLEIGAKEALDALYDDFDIIIITARDEHHHERKYTGEMMKKDTLEYFKENEIKYDEIHFSCTDKHLACKQYGCDILIDDSPKHIKECADNGIPVIVASHFYNSQYIGYPYTMYGVNWLDIKNKVYEMCGASFMEV